MGRVLVQLIIFKRETDMKYILILLILAALGGCVVVPEGYDDNHGGFGHFEHGRGDGNWGHGS